ncbi:2-hydroxyacid dehydrogenase [Negadavirga shengliensis]|uniref:2-hydroxyacid dehydrogenase n=1 Tax=Negadavirga shengliensis TaxID=1389218 RepID=A0ABV9T144_9BACT
MSLAIIAPNKDVQEWVDLFTEIDPSITIQVYPEIDDRQSVEVVVLWQHPHGILDKFPNLRLICSMGSGVDHIVSDPSLPRHLPITRIVDPRLTFSMTNYVVMGILNFHRQIFRYIKDQQRKVWDMSNPEIDITVGVLGVGELGGDVLDKVAGLGIKTVGYGNNPKTDFRHPYYYGHQLEEFLKSVNVIVCLLPLTQKTEGFLNIGFFKKCQKGSYLINVARGKHLVEEDLITALDEGYLEGAMLDVFHTEPLPESHPFWDHDRIMITPHIASITNPSAAAPQIMTNYKNLKESKPLINPINQQQGY